MAGNAPEQPPSPEDAAGPGAPQGPQNGSGEGKPPRRQVLVAEVVLLYGAILALAGLPAFGASWGALRFDNPLVITAALIYLPFIPYAQGKISLARMGIGASGFQKSLKLAIAAGLPIFVAFVAIWYLAGGAALGLPAPRPLDSPFPYEMSQWTKMVASQFLAVAIPEEWFFRGYLQERLTRLWPREIGKGALRLSVGAVLASFLFGLAHAVLYHSAVRLNVCFPALLFAWVRERSGHLGGPVLLHASSNLLLYALAVP